MTLQFKLSCLFNRFKHTSINTMELDTHPMVERGESVSSKKIFTIMDLTVENVIPVLKKKNYKIFENDTKNYNLNVVGIRTNDLGSNAFNDWRVIFWKYQGKWKIIKQQITTDPGLYWRQNPENVEGVAILKEGQYCGCWTIGLHKGQYKALVQCKPITVIRDFDKDVYLDIYEQKDLDKFTKKVLTVGGVPTVEYYDGTKLVQREQTGLFGINQHRAKDGGTSTQVDKWSAGCQVVAADSDHDKYMELCDKAAVIYGNSFTYTLINEKDFV